MRAFDITFLNARSKPFESSPVPVLRAVSSSRFARSSSEICSFFAGIGSLSFLRAQTREGDCYFTNWTMVHALRKVIVGVDRIEYCELSIEKATWTKIGRLSLCAGRIRLAVYRRPGYVALAGIIFCLLVESLRLFDFCFERSELCHRRISFLLKLPSLLPSSKGEVEHLCCCNSDSFRVGRVADFARDFVDRTRGRQGGNALGNGHVNSEVCRDF